MEEDIAKQELINLPIKFEEVETGTGCLTKLFCGYLYFLFLVLPLLALLALIGLVIYILVLFS